MLLSSEIYLCYNAMNVVLFVGSQADPALIQSIFKVESFSQIAKEMTEEEIFADAEEVAYVGALYSLIN